MPAPSFPAVSSGAVRLPDSCTHAGPAVWAASAVTMVTAAALACAAAVGEPAGVAAGGGFILAALALAGLILRVLRRTRTGWTLDGDVLHAAGGQLPLDAVVKIEQVEAYPLGSTRPVHRLVLHVADGDDVFTLRSPSVDDPATLAPLLAALEGVEREQVEVPPTRGLIGDR